jgi:prepilin-type N-terminal cleavage/methylation domain-containing protein
MNGQRGFTMSELVVVVAIMGLSLAIGSLYLEPMETPLQSGAIQMESFFRQSRLRAMATTSAYRVAPSDSSNLAVERAATCSATTWATEDDMELELPKGVAMSDTSWSVCFSSRGISMNNITVTLQHSKYGLRQVEVLLGGTTRVLR